MSLRHSLLHAGLTLSVLLGGSFATPTIAQPLRPELRIGSTGTTVSELQATLRLLGYYTGEATGTYNEATVIAVYQFQKAAKIPETGIMDQLTWTTLFPITATNPPTAKPPKTISAPPVIPPLTLPSANPNFIQPENLPLLREGMEGEVVKLLQRRLTALGYYSGAIDGVYGRQTLLAAIAAQKTFKLDADGIVGLQTWRKLLE